MFLQINKHSTFLVMLGFILVNIWFNYQGHLSQLWQDDSLTGNIPGEIQVNEWRAEVVYQRLKNLENPYQPFSQYLYPIGVDTAGASIGFVFMMLILRPFLSVHQSFSMIVILNLFLANLGMYLLLRQLKLKKLVAFLVGLMFGYMTFLTPRIGGHLEFTTHYFLPWFYLVIFKFFTEKKALKRSLWAILTGFILAMTIYHNIYYFFILGLSIPVLTLYFVLIDFKQVVSSLWRFKFYLILAILVFSITLYPWIKGIYEAMLFSAPPLPLGWAGAIEFSSDLFGFFIPSVHNYYYGKKVIKYTRYIPFAKGIFENFSYPGVIILASWGYLFYLVIKNKKNKLRQQIKPFILTSLFFTLLTLGPFLHVAGQWAWSLEENIKLVIPLPFALLHYLPFLSNLRVPGRFAVGMIFFSYLGVGYILNEFFSNKSKTRLVISSIVLCGVFVIDHRYHNHKLTSQREIPHQLYQSIAQDPDQTATVMRIPFVVRDGLMYLGSIHQILVNEGQSVHHKAVLGGYAGRLPLYAFDYYLNNPFLGYLSILLDHNYQHNGYLIMRESNQLRKFKLAESLRAIDFLNLKYVVLQKPKPNTSTPLSEIKRNLNSLGFKEAQSQGNYILLTRELSQSEFLEINLGQVGDEIMLAVGWEDRELDEKGDDYRWSQQKSSLLFNLKESRPMQLNFTLSSFNRPQAVSIYLNMKQVATINISTQKNNYQVSLPILPRGLNQVHFVFDNSFQPQEIIPMSLDDRELSAKVYEVSLIDTNDH